MSSKVKSSKTSSKCLVLNTPAPGDKAKFRGPKKSLSSEVLAPSKTASARKMVKGTKSKNSIASPSKEASQGLLTDLGGFSNEGELDHAFDKFWKAVTSGIEKNAQVSLPRNTPIDAKMSEIQRRIKLNQAILQSANEKLKSINFQAERQNLSQWKEKMFTNFGREDGKMCEEMKALDLEIEKLKQRKLEKSVFLKSSPGIANFHNTMESTLNILDKIQNASDFQNYENSFHAIKKEFDLDYIKAPETITVSDEE